MIFGIGVDTVEIVRIADIIKVYSDRFVNRVLTSRESNYCYKKKDPYPHFSARFAAKEAMVKALGIGFTQGLKWTDIEVGHTKLGAPILLLSNLLDKKVKQKGIKMYHISLTHSKTIATASVVLEKF